MLKTLRDLRATLASLAVLFAASLPAFAVSNTVVISQVYGAGGNSGAVYNQDYVELFNNGTTAVSLAGYSLQYRSAAGASAIPSTEIAALPSVTLQPGQYYLFGVSAPSATVGTTVPADAQLSSPYLNLAAGAGQVILSNSTVAQAAGCVTSDPSVVDFVGYGSTAVCSEGSAPTGTLSATLAAFRTKPCVDTDNNAADFSTGAPAPRTSTTAVTPCGGGTSTFAFTGASANPTTVSVGGTTLLTARITPATGSTNVAVTVDLSSVGGSSTQPLYDDGTHGDPTAGDNVFNYTATIGGTPSGTVTLPFKATDAQAHSATGSVTLTIQATTATLPIHTLQTGAPGTSYVGTMVTTTGIVTAITNAGFYLEARDGDQDADASTSEGIFVVSGASASVVVGNELKVTGTVKLSSASSATAATEIAGTVTTTIVSTGNALPTPITLAVADDSPAGGFTQFLRLQSMRVLIPSFTVTAPTGGSLVEATETITSDGTFYGTVTGVKRPLIEPGVSVLETALPTATYCTATVTTACVPRFDGNPENLFIQSTGLGGAAINVNAGQTISNLLGVVDLTTFNFDSLRNIQILLDKAAPGTPSAATTYVAVPAAAANEFTVASTNLQHFYSSTPFTGAVTLTAEAYARRLSKASLEIRNVQGTPDIVGLQEIGSLPILNDLAAKISADAVAAGQPDPKYATCLYQGNDSSDINTAFLVKSTRVSITDCTQFGKTLTYTNSTGAQATLNDRPPLVLHAVVNITGYPAFPITVISNHLKSLIGIDGTDASGANTRLKKENQDEYLAQLIQGYQAKGEHVISVGDYNSFGVNDGYVDNLGVITGNPPAAGTVVVGPTAAYVAPSPKLVDLETTVADPLQRYDYTFIGNAQTLDHIVVTADLVPGAHIAFSHENADFALINLNDGTTPLAGSDHDGAVGFFPLLLTGQTSSATLTPATQDFGSVVTGNTSAAQTFTLTNTGNIGINVNSLTATGDFSRTTTTCGATLAASALCTATVTFSPSAAGARTGSLLVSTSAVTGTNLSSTLTGSGLAATVTVTVTPASAAFGSVPFGGVSAAQTLTLTNSGNSAATLTSIATSGDFSKGATTCGATLAASATCTIAITFAPTTLGARTGLLSIVTASSATAITAALTGTGTAQATLTPATATFTAVVGSPTTQSFTLTNTAGTALTVGTPALTGSGFTQSSTCTATLASAATCTVTVTFNPTAAGTASGSLAIPTTLGVIGNLLTASFTGTATVPPNFLLTPTAQSATLTAGSGAVVNLTLASQGGYTGTVRFVCSGAPAGSTCTPSSPSLTLAANSASSGIPSSNLAVTITTTGATGAAFGTGFWTLLVSLALGLLLLARRRAIRLTGLLIVLLSLTFNVVGCSSAAPPSRTPAGTYPYTITATDGTLTHTATYTLTVQ